MLEPSTTGIDIHGTGMVFNMLTTTKILSKRLTWNLRMTAFTRNLLFQDTMFSFHVYLVRVLSWRCSKVWIIAPLYWGLPLSWTTTPLLKSGMCICTYIDYPIILTIPAPKKQIYQPSPWPCQFFVGVQARHHRHWQNLRCQDHRNPRRGHSFHQLSGP